ncbi:MAG: penicillin-binding protein activator [Pseudomonadota bacterium]
MRYPTKIVRLCCAAVLALALASCGGLGNVGDLFSRDSEPEPGQILQTPNTPSPQIPNAGGPKVAFLLPLGIKGGAANVARSLKEAGELALVEAGAPSITLLTKDTLGTPEGARAAVDAALNDGAELIVGPLFQGSVRAISPSAQGRGAPVIAFSTASAAAGNGVYLMSFLPEQDVANIIRYASESGRRRFAALIPETAYGGIIERALATEVQRRGGQVVTIVRYPRTALGASQAASKIAAKLSDPVAGADTLLIAEGGKMLSNLSSTLTAAGVNPQTTKIIGTSLWDDPSTSSIDIAIGGWYPGVDPQLTRAFAARFRQTYGSEPKRIASLAYDAISLAIALGRQNAGQLPGQRFPITTLTNPQGFQGSNGLFRFTNSGLNERGLAILEVTQSGPRVISPAPTTFSANF